MPMIHFQDFYLAKQAEWGRRITIKEIAEGAELSRDTITRLIKNRTNRIDEDTILKLCKFFNVPKGQPIPFLINDPT